MEALWLIPLVFITYSIYCFCLEGETKQKTYLDKLMENPEFKERFKKEYRNLKIAEFKQMVKDIKKQYKYDPQGLKLFTMGYKEMIKKLKEENNE